VPSYGDRYKWTGREFDSDTSLQHNRRRSYAPSIGRWTGEDPIGIATWDTNFYWYANNNSVNATDPMGLARRAVRRLCETDYTYNPRRVQISVLVGWPAVGGVGGRWGNPNEYATGEKEIRPPHVSVDQRVWIDSNLDNEAQNTCNTPGTFGKKYNAGMTTINYQFSGVGKYRVKIRATVYLWFYSTDTKAQQSGQAQATITTGDGKTVWTLPEAKAWNHHREAVFNKVITFFIRVQTDCPETRMLLKYDPSLGLQGPTKYTRTVRAKADFLVVSIEHVK
jgi:RHS repeat-associated protein